MSWNPVTETREWHCATSEEACLQMESRFKKEGLKVKLVATPKTGDRILKVVCIFDGPDADPHAQRFQPYQDVD